MYILRALDMVGDVILWTSVAYSLRTWYKLNAARNQSRRLLAAIQKVHDEALALPSSLPKTFPTGTQFAPLRELPPELQRRIVGHFRGLEREENAMDGD